MAPKNIPEPEAPIPDEPGFLPLKEEDFDVDLKSLEEEDDYSDVGTRYSQWYSDIPDMIDGRYRKVSEIGSGNFATVLHVLDTHKKNSRNKHISLAMKIWQKSVQTDEGRAEGENEIAILKKIRENGGEDHYCLKLIHEFRVPILDKARLCATFELQGESLEKLIIELRKISGKLRLAQLQSFARQLLHAAAFLHGHNIVHADIKPANILLKPRALEFLTVTKSQPLDERKIVIVRNTTITLSDNGMSVDIQDPESKRDIENPPGSPMYHAPEMMLRQEWSYRADVYAIGIVVFELTFDHPYPRYHCERHRLALIEKFLGKFPADLRNNKDFDQEGFVKKEFSFRQTDCEKSIAEMKPIEEWFTLPANHRSKPDEELFCDLLKKILRLKKDIRFEAYQALKHPFFEKVIEGDPAKKSRFQRLNLFSR